ncbi:HEPN domain-containing protein [Lachnospiraceae bacterium 46-15]
MINNSYIDIAENDLEYLESVVKTGSTFYNQLAVQCEQIAEKFLKGYLDRLMVNEDVSDLLRKHNMKKIASKLNEMKPEIALDTIGLAYLTDFYFDARYPGDDFYTVTKEEFEKCLEIMYDTIRKLRTNFGDK